MCIRICFFAALFYHPFQKYREENKLDTLFLVFTLLSVFLACLGLFGLATFAIERRTKEVAIRKMLGASEAAISTLMSREFFKMIAIAIVVAFPIAWYFLNRWLQNYAYRITIHWWIFGLAAAVTIIIAIITLSFETIKVAISSPIKRLRNE